MTVGTLSVSIRADRIYLRALKALANEKDMKIGDLIRESVDAAHSEELQSHLDFFYANSEDINPQTTTNIPAIPEPA